MNVTMHFVECEHEGDLDSYLEDIRNCGGVVKGSEINYEAETADVEVDISNKEEFDAQFKKTDTCDFTGYRHSIK